MRLPFQIRSRVNSSAKFASTRPVDWASRTDWENREGLFSCSNGRYKILEDEKYGAVIAETKNINYNMK